MTCISCCLFNPKGCSTRAYQKSDHCVAQSLHKLAFMHSYNSSIDSSCVLRMTFPSPGSARAKMLVEKQQCRLSITGCLLRNNESSLCGVHLLHDFCMPVGRDTRRHLKGSSLRTWMCPLWGGLL